ncbi:sigma-70 family RNA polymerase sigma factor [Roseicyclus marinus]|uniref:sigma-70 family RNA polymerase sigma factor n=1 Tax=Roseicyclus marinus TaxID=2161673 RepID=UPI00240FE07F|nr:sigma-70 family RNA polymerase sigma factor [Roseicyclus marinus]MDG3041306.1 sigma-70 family RNA polymerase sigma factor [Roseicyclus marinus]
MLLSNDRADHTAEGQTVAPAARAMAFERERRREAVTAQDTIDVQWADRIAAIARSQDQAAFAEVFRHFAPRVKAFLMKSGADEALAEECMQDVMATLWNKAHLYDPSRAAVSTWIFTIARNRKIDLLRRYARPEPEELPWGPEESPDQADILALQQETTKLADAIRTLPEKQRQLIERAYFGDLTHSEIAAETGLPLGTIKSRIRLALERLRHAMT